MAGDSADPLVLTPEQCAELDQHAREVGLAIGWTLGFAVAPNPVYVGLTADALDDDIELHHIFFWGPQQVEETTVEQVHTLLDQLEAGELQIVVDPEGDPRLM